MASSADSPDWGWIARALFWFGQTLVATGVAVLALATAGVRSAPALSAVGTLIAGILLFRQVDALVEQKTADS